MHRSFYKNINKTDQDNFILKHCDTKQCKRERLKSGARGPNKFSTNYFISVKNPTRKMRICKSAFLSILNIGKDRVTGVLQRSFNEGNLAKERRGGDRKSNLFLERKESVKKFIESLQAVEPHYCRSKSSVRLYLPADLTINKLWLMYNDHNRNLPVKQSFFRNIFNTKYNAGFGSPLKDTCSRCSELNFKIKKETDERTKQELITTKRFHSLQAKAFYDLLRSDDKEILTISFDCQKNNPLPKLPDQAAYFSRQINLYNFTVVVGKSMGKKIKDNVHIFYWNETENPKASNQIASAIFHLLKTINIHEDKKTVRLFADGCGGQNKNSTLIGMCSNWLQCHAPPQVKNLEIIFPVVGHSFLPPDRIFAHIEKETKRLSVICDPEKYVEVFRNHGKVYHLTTDVSVHDWKKETSRTFKPPGMWHFKFNQAKRFILRRGRKNVSISGETTYRSNFCVSKYLNKKCMTCVDLNPSIVPRGNKIASAKIEDVTKLLSKHFGEDWRSETSLRFYKKTEETNENFFENRDIQCVRLEEAESSI